MSLSDEETMQIIRNQRGEALLCANRNRVCINIKASPILYDILTTKRSDLEKRKNMKKVDNYDNIVHNVNKGVRLYV